MKTQQTRVKAAKKELREEELRMINARRMEHQGQAEFMTCFTHEASQAPSADGSAPHLCPGRITLKKVEGGAHVFVSRQATNPNSNQAGVPMDEGGESSEDEVIEGTPPPSPKSSRFSFEQNYRYMSGTRSLAWAQQMNASQRREDVCKQLQRARDAAGVSLRKQAAKMKKKVGDQMGEPLQVGDVVQIGINKADMKFKPDSKVLTVVVVAVETKDDQKSVLYRVACSAGVMQNCYTQPYLTRVHQDAGTVGLGDVVTTWHAGGMTVLTEAAAASESSILRFKRSAVGHADEATAKRPFVQKEEQLKCACKGRCNSTRCGCFKLGWRCNTNCHPGSVVCENCSTSGPQVHPRQQ